MNRGEWPRLSTPMFSYPELSKYNMWPIYECIHKRFNSDTYVLKLETANSTERQRRYLLQLRNIIFHWLEFQQFFHNT